MNIQEIPTKRKEKPRVCAYVRVSTDSEAQEDSFAFQSNYWQKRFASDEFVEYVGLFSDEGIGGGCMKKRDGLKKMFQKVRNGEIDIIYTKSVSRFARNKVELMEIVREFRDLGVEIIFESEKIHTLDPKCGLILTVMASLAEEELISMSQNQKWAARKRFANGSVELTRILGYDMVKGKYKKSDELTEQMAEFLVKATVKDWTITFEFQNGYKTTKKYTNGRAGNVNGKLCKHKT